ncbi:MAG: hypothetical protein ABG776_00635 [Cyanobacteria bacterium J06555_13]
MKKQAVLKTFCQDCERLMTKPFQITFYTPETAQQLEHDIRLSGHKNRTRYCNKLFEKLFSLPPLCGETSKIGGLFKLLEVIDRIPMKAINDLALQSNRTPTQMLIQIFQVGLQNYSEQRVVLNNVHDSAPSFKVR